MSTQKLFYENPYTDSFEATVIACEPYKDKYGVILDKTQFFPEEGGQDADKGIIKVAGISSEIPVLDVRIKDDVITHVVDIPIEVGLKVSGTIDYARRFDYMQQHSGEHIVSGLAHNLFDCTNVGFHLSERDVTLDFDKLLTDEQVKELEIKANEAIYKNIPVKVYFPSKEELDSLTYRSKIELTGSVRIVEIQDIDRCACCAPHVLSTGQIGIIKFLDYEPHRGGMRITICCGKRAFFDYSGKQDVISKASALLSVPQERIPEAINKCFDDTHMQSDEKIRMQKKYLNKVLSGVSENDNSVVIFEEGIDTQAMREVINTLTSTREGFCSFFNGNDKDGYNFIIGSSKLDCKELANKMRNELGAKCGGSSAMIQGNTTATALEIKKVL